MIETRDSTANDNVPVAYNPDRLAQIFIDAFPVMNITEQQLALELYALLSEGDTVPLERLSERTGMPLAEVKTVLESWPGVFFDDNHCIVGFWGVAVDETNHHFKVDGKRVYTWCAWDMLFIPELLGATAHITSHCALSGDEITLTLSPRGIEYAQPDQIMVSFLIPEEGEFQENIITSFCHYVFFFRSRESGERWVAEHPSTFLLSLDDAFAIGKKMNAARYNLTLN
ncbi:MAG: organomercurial lyase MerB [Gammaproteobacteria bacterium]|nr:MAG: organomercurial lyase MerB [Gammaproteobacteria bacterium]